MKFERRFTTAGQETYDKIRSGRHPARSAILTGQLFFPQRILKYPNSTARWQLTFWLRNIFVKPESLHS